ncbi:coiled-coil domain-containing protein CG32809-like isoform X2 [Oculina patagonica]
MPTARWHIRVKRTRSCSSRGLKGKLFGGVKVKRARSFSGREKQKWSATKQPKDDTATTVSDSEAKSHARKPRRRTTGGAEVGEEVEKAKRLQGQGNSSDQDAHGTQTLSRREIIAMVKKRFGLKPGEENGHKPNGIPEEPPAIPPPPASSPKQQRYELLLDKPGTYPTMPRKEENHVSHTSSTPGVVYLQYGDEIKRAMLPAGLGGIDQVQSLFNQTFPDKIKNNDNRKTIYIKDNSCGVFYELDNVGDLSNKSHLKVLESRPFQNGAVPHPVSSSTAVHTGAQVTSTPLPNHSHIAPADVIHSGGGGGSLRYTRTTTVSRQASGGPSVTTVTRVVGKDQGEYTATHSGVTTGGTLMDQKKVALPGLGTTLRPSGRRPSRDPVEDQLDTLTNMLEDALKTGSHDSLPGKSAEESGSSSQSSFIYHGSTEGNEPSHLQTFRTRFRSDSGNESLSSDVSPSPPLEGKSKHVPAPPPRASSSRESSLKYSQTLQREHIPRGTKRDISSQYHTQTLPLPSSKPKQRSLDSPTPLSSNSSTSSGSHASVKYEGRVKDKRALELRASTLRGEVRMLKAELSQLKQFQTFQAQQFDELMRNAKELIVQRVARMSNADDTALKSGRRKVQVEEMTYVRGKNDLNRHISELESEVEMVRLDVVQKRCIGNPAEVDSLNSQLSIISRQVSDLKSQFAELHDNMKSIMASELEVIVQGDKFLKEEPSKLENLVSRCKHITGTLFTLQKLVSAQQQMKTESEASFSSLEDVDKDVIDSIRSVHREYLHKRNVDNNYTEEPRSPAGRGRPRVRFYDEVTQLP